MLQAWNGSGGMVRRCASRSSWESDPDPDDDLGTVSQPLERSKAHAAARQAVLFVLGDGGSLETLRTPRLIPVGQQIAIGRRAGADGGGHTLVLTDRTVSARHARIRFVHHSPNSFIIEDLGSRNGVFIDGRRIDGFATLRNGALIFLGSQSLVFRLMTAAQLLAVKEDSERPFGPLSTLSPELALTAARLRRLALSPIEILLIGETGVGKELVARAVHAASGRGGRFVAVDCASLPAARFESELLGHSSASASERQVGLPELAACGTLFLDEVGEMAGDLQAKLLPLVRDHRFTQQGATQSFQPNARIIAATSRMVAEPHRQMHESLLGRLGALAVELPPLRDRVEDIGRLVAHFIERERPVGGEETRPGDDGEVPLFEAEAFQALLLYAWPLNVRELSKVTAQVAMLCRGRPIGIADLPLLVTEGLRIIEKGEQGGEANPSLHGAEPLDPAPAVEKAERAVQPPAQPSARPPVHLAVQLSAHPSVKAHALHSAAAPAPAMSPGVEKERIISTLAACAGNQRRAARMLGMSRRTLLTRLDRHGIARPQKGARPN